MRASVDVVDRGGTVQRVVAPAGSPYPYEPRWSPDDSMLAWAAHDGIHVGNPDGSAERLLVPASTTCTGSCTILHFVWSPDGALTVRGAGHQTNELLLVPVDGGAPQTLEPMLPDVSYTPSFWHGATLPLVSPDLRFRAVITEVSRYRQQLRIVDTSTGRSRVIAGVNPTSFAAWSPDSRTFAVVESSRHVVTVAAGRAGCA